MIDRSQWKSPATGTIMQEIDLKDTSVLFDEQSGGYWLERGKLATLAGQHNVKPEDVATGIHMKTHKGRLCPEDGSTTLMEFEFADHSGIKLDICPSCKGIWLDGGEIDDVLTYVDTQDFKQEVPTNDSSIKLSHRVLLFLYALSDHPPLY